MREVAIKVESVAAFSRAHDLGLEIVGYPLGPYRVGRVAGRARRRLAVVERRGYLGFEPFPGELAREGRMTPHAARDALAARDLWQARRRRFDDDAEGFDATEATLDRVIELAGSTDLACHLVFEVERDYWQSRNRAARVQKARQDRLGLGWANHDHHTFRCSRRFFPRLIGMFETAGLPRSASGSTPASTPAGARRSSSTRRPASSSSPTSTSPPRRPTHDFAHHALPDLPRPNTVGLWVGLHGESILEAGMHHLEAQFDFDALRDGLKAEAGHRDDEAVLRLPVPPPGVHRRRALAGRRSTAPTGCLALGWIDADQHAKFLREGTIGSHLENLQRREGYKGFNQQAVSAIIAATDPRLH